MGVVEVRPARAGEGQAISDLFDKTLGLPMRQFVAGIDSSALIDQPGGASEVALVAVAGGEIVGAVAASPPINYLKKTGMPRESQYAFACVIAKLMASAVDPAWQRQGVGRRMVAEVLNFYRSRDYRWIYGQYVNGTTAQDFYRNLGFRCHNPGEALAIPIAEITGQALPAVVGPRIGMETNDCAFDLVL